MDLRGVQDGGIAELMKELGKKKGEQGMVMSKEPRKMLVPSIRYSCVLVVVVVLIAFVYVGCVCTCTCWIFYGT